MLVKSEENDIFSILSQVASISAKDKDLLIINQSVYCSHLQRPELTIIERGENWNTQR